MLENRFPFSYFAGLKTGKIVLWCYLIWYLVTMFNYFDPSPTMWLNSLGLSVVIGYALLLSVGKNTAEPDNWQTFRLFMMPFGVSSFSSLIKGHGFILIAPPVLTEFLFSIASCFVFVIGVYALKWLQCYQHTA